MIVREKCLWRWSIVEYKSYDHGSTWWPAGYKGKEKQIIEEKAKFTTHSKSLHVIKKDELF